jgi:hypothetical protein
MLDPEEFKSIWEIAFRWEGMEPLGSDEKKPPDGVVKKIEKLIWAFREKQLQLRDSAGQYVYDNTDSIFDILFLNRTRKILKTCFKRKVYPKSVLDCLFIKRGDLLKWCQEDFTLLPEFWILSTQTSPQATGKTPVSPQGEEEREQEDESFLASLKTGAHRPANPKSATGLVRQEKTSLNE